MNTVAMILGYGVMVYFSIVGLVMICTKCSFEDAREKVASFFKENEYELASDFNYKHSINEIAKDILGDARYDELCKLDKYSKTLLFCDNHNGLPSVKITLNFNDDSEKKRLETVIEEITRKYLLHYGKSPYVKLLLEWSHDAVLDLPRLVLLYSRNKKECTILDVFEEANVKKMALKYSSVVDETDDLL